MSLPFVTIVMPVRNEAAYIRRSLGTVRAQDYPAERMEILVVDGQSTDGTRQIIHSYQASHPNLKIIENPERIVPAGLNLAVRASRGEILIRVDGHCEIHPDYVRECVKTLQEANVDCVGGPIETVGETYTARVIAQAMSSRFGVGGSAFRTEKSRRMFTDTVAFPAYKRSVIEKVGLFDEELVRNQDDEYNFRLRGLGGKILLSPDIRSRYFSRASLRSLWRQYFQYGFWKVRVLQKHPRQMSLRHFVPAAFSAALIGSGTLSIVWPGIRVLLALLLAAYFSASLLASAIVASRSQWRYLPLLPLVYLILHLSYGLGFLAGLARFAGRWGDRQGQVPNLQHADV